MNKVSKASGFASLVFTAGLVAGVAAPHQILVVAHHSFFESTVKDRERERRRERGRFYEQGRLQASLAG
jgi:hypothetical protein